MLGWIIFTAVVLLWMVVAAWRAVVFVGNDMLESWQAGEDYTDMLFGEAVRAGLVDGITWPITTPARLIGKSVSSLLYRPAYRRADRMFQALGARPPVPESKPDITGELEKIPAMPVAETRSQALMRREAEAGRKAYEKRLADETDVGSIPAVKS